MSEKKSYAPGVYDITNQEYHASEGISRSGISEFKKSPLHYWDRYLNPKKPPRKTSTAMTIGSAVHTLIMEPEKFEQEFCVFKKVNLSTKAGKEYKKEFEVLSIGKEIIREEDMEKVKEIVDSVHQNELVMPILHEADFEKSIYWTHSATGLTCKARPDIWKRKQKIICDVKTTRNASRASFARAIMDGDYHIQAAMQMIGVLEVTGEAIEDYMFLVIPNERPYFPYIYNLDTETIKKGIAEFNDAMKLIKQCYDNNDWHKERNSIQEIGLSEYALNSNPFILLEEQYSNERSD